MGKLVEFIDAAGLVTQLSYDANAKLSSITDPAGRVSRFTMDAVGNLIEVHYPDGSARSLLDRTLSVLVDVEDDTGAAVAPRSNRTSYTEFGYRNHILIDNKHQLIRAHRCYLGRSTRLTTTTTSIIGKHLEGSWGRQHLP